MAKETTVTKEMIEEITDANDETVKLLLYCALLYIQEEQEKKDAVKRILRYIRSDDYIGFHDLYVKGRQESKARQIYLNEFLKDGNSIDMYFYDFGRAFLQVTDAYKGGHIPTG
jgi:hypothetical protein